MRAATYNCEQCNNPKVKIDPDSLKKFKTKKQIPISFVAYCEICQTIRTFIKAI